MRHVESVRHIVEGLSAVALSHLHQKSLKLVLVKL